MISNTLPQSLIDNPILSQWIAFAEPGRVRVGSGKVELSVRGQPWRARGRGPPIPSIRLTDCKGEGQ